MTRIGDWMHTYTGKQFWPLDPKPEEISLEDIAHSLSNQCRFAGHCTEFYSVAQHSVMVSRNVPKADAAWGLMHDAAEAYLVDLPRPVKYSAAFGEEYREIEARLMECIAVRFGMPFVALGCYDIPISVKLADYSVLMAEKRDLMRESPAPWGIEAAPIASIITGWKPSRAKNSFLHAAEKLGIR